MGGRACIEYLMEFVLPLVEGGEMRVSKPLTVEEVRAYTEQLPHASEAVIAIEAARTNVLAQLVVRPPSLILDAEEVFLTAAVHNLLFFTHPDRERWTATKRRLGKVLKTAEVLAAQPLTAVRTRVLARHGLLHNVFDVTRNDVRVSWWTGSASFFGQAPPSRLSRWPGLRRVRSEVTVAKFDTLLGIAETLPVIASLVRRTPLTPLLTTSTIAPPIYWEGSAFLLRDAEIARAIAYSALAHPTMESRLEACCRYAVALLRMLERDPPSADVRAVCAFLVHLTVLLVQSELGSVTELRSLSQFVPKDGAEAKYPGVTALLAMPSALALLNSAIARPPGLDDGELGNTWREHNRAVQERVGSAVVSALAQRLARCIGGGLPLSAGQDHGSSLSVAQSASSEDYSS